MWVKWIFLVAVEPRAWSRKQHLDRGSGFSAQRCSQVSQGQGPVLAPVSFVQIMHQCVYRPQILREYLRVTWGIS